MEEDVLYTDLIEGKSKYSLPENELFLHWIKVNGRKIKIPYPIKENIIDISYDGPYIKDGLMLKATLLKD